MKRKKCTLVVMAAGLVALGSAAVPASSPDAARAGTAAQLASQVKATDALGITETWTQQVPDAQTGEIIGSSPIVATLADGQLSAVVGDEAGHLYAYHLSDGTSPAGWGGIAVGAPVASTPSVSGSGAGAIVYVGSGNTAAPHSGGYSAFNGDGSQRWYHSAPNFPQGGTSGVQASMSVGDLQGGTDVVAGDLGQEEEAFDGPSGTLLNGFPWLQADAQFSTAALVPLGGGSVDSIIEGGASTAGLADNTQYGSGGHLRILSPTGNAGQAESNGGLACDYDTDEEVDSSPAVGANGPGGATSIVFGTGSYYAGASTENHLLAVNTACQLEWNTPLDGFTGGSPALVDALGNGGLQVAEGTVDGTGGTVYLLNGATGSIIWSAPAAGEVIGSITSADLSGAGYQDLLVPTTNGLQVLDGKTGAQIDMLSTNLVIENAPLVTDDPNGTIGITVAAGDVSGYSEVDHYEVAGSNGAAVDATGAWPMFHHDPQLTGDAVPAAAPTPAPATGVACSPPAGGPVGYLETASDGGVFNFGNLPFCGSTGAVALNRPIVGSAETRDGGGYWLVASDGGIFAFGDAGFYGSTGAVALNQPIVGMAATPDGKGYWLVASDGGIFAFGDAGFYGSTGGSSLNRPIVGIASTPDGRGYWLVASDGGIFAFGDAQFYGSTGGTALNRPIVGLASTGDGGGYWLVASDGGIFAFGDAAFHGSTGSIALNRPVIGIEATPDGGGYRLVASDGGVFDFGDASFYGSEGGAPLNRPIVSVTGF